MGHRHVVVWSGGYDSTLLISIVIPNMNLNDTLVLASVETELTGSPKTQRESLARKRILGKVRTLFPDTNIETIIIKLDVEFSDGPGPNRGLGQPIIWASSLIPWLRPGDTVYFGYIKNDDATQLLPYVKGMFENMSYLQMYGFSNQQVSFEFPLAVCANKPQVLIWLRSWSEEIFDLCTCCESLMNDDHCSACVPCRHLKSALVTAAIEDYNNANFYLTRLDKWFGIHLDLGDINRITDAVKFESNNNTLEEE